MTHTVTIAASGLKVGKKIDQGRILKIRVSKKCLYVTVSGCIGELVLRPDQPVTVIK